MKKVHILAPNRVGGVQNFCRDLGARIGSAKAHVHFHATRDESKHSHLTYNPRHSTRSQSLRIWTDIRLSLNDVLVCNDGRELMWIAASGVTNPCVYIMHGDNNAYYDALDLNGDICDIVVCINPGIAKVLQAKKNLPQVLYLPQLFKSSSRNIDELLSFKAIPSTVRVVFIGRPTLSKGFDVLEESIDASPDLQFDVVLSDTLISQHPLFNLPHVRVHQNISHENVLRILEHADLLMLPSRSEGLPLSILEALSCGCSVICRPLLGFQEAFGEASQVHFASTDEDFIEYVKSWTKQTAIEITESRHFAESHLKKVEFGLTKLLQTINMLPAVEHRKRKRFGWRDFFPNWVFRD